MLEGWATFRQTDRQTDRSKWFRRIVALTILLLLFSRAITITHNVELHPDEPVFFLAADSLRRFLTRTADVFEEVKAYPEGAIVLQLPFHVLATLFQHYTGVELSLRLCSRIASVFYFTLGAVFGMIIEYFFLGKSIKSVLAYAAILVFSIMHMEQSRYGTGDAISFFLTMIILYLTLIGETKEQKKRAPYWLSAGLLSGLLCAVKYPLLFWGLIPGVTAWRMEKGKNRKRVVIMIVAAVIVGFMIGSPKASADPIFVLRAVKSETIAYVLSGNVTEVGGPVNHVLSLILYAFLYAGFPCSPLLAAAVWKERNARSGGDDEHAFLLNRLLPYLIVVFFSYNLFAKTLFMRTYYPFFFLMDLYVAEYLGKRYTRGRQAALSLLMVLFVARGMYYTAVLTEKRGPEKLDYLITSASDKSWRKTTLLTPGYFVSFHRENLINPQDEDLLDSRYENNDRLCLESGEMVITGGIEFSRGNGYIFPVNNKTANAYCERWEAFKSKNQDYFAGAVYPRSYYYLFGYWIKGTTGCSCEFPTNYVYYRGTEGSVLP